MRPTRKYLAARRAAEAAGMGALSDRVLYDTLEIRGFTWDRISGRWVSDAVAPRPTVGSDDATAIEIRVMASAETYPAVAVALRTGMQASGYTLALERGPFDNRRGTGQRWYLTYRKG